MIGKASVKGSHNHFALLVASLQVICHQLLNPSKPVLKREFGPNGVKIENLLWYQIEKLKLTLILIVKSLTFLKLTLIK